MTVPKALYKRQITGNPNARGVKKPLRTFAAPRIQLDRIAYRIDQMNQRINATRTAQGYSPAYVKMVHERNRLIQEQTRLRHYFNFV